MTDTAAKQPPQGSKGPAKPNVLFLFTDDQREDTVRALGNPHIKTPNLDGLVREGFIFTNAYCMGGFSGAVCLPSRMMTLRGRAWFSVRQMPEDAPNFAKSMNQAGYVSYHHGKRGNTDQHVHKSFNHSHYLDDRTVRDGGYMGRQAADDAVRFLRSWKKGTVEGASDVDGRRKPFFMYLAPAGPHDPRIAAKKYLDQYDPDKIPAPENFLPLHPFNNGELVIRDERLAPWPRTKKVIREHLRDYYAVITCMDEQFGRIFAALKEIGEYDNTIILFSSDQGIAIGSHGLMGKQNLYEHSMGVPLVVRGPGIPKGSSEAFAYLFDVYPTVCELVGAQVPASLEGKSLVPILRGQGRNVRDTIFLAYRDVQRAVRRGKWKLIRYPQINHTQLFDLAADPHETKDLSGDPACADTVKELMALMAEQQKLFGDDLPLTSKKPEPAEVDLEFYKKAAAKPWRPGGPKKKKR